MTGKSFGCIADEVEKIFPQAVWYREDGIPGGIHYDILLEAIKFKNALLMNKKNKND